MDNYEPIDLQKFIFDKFNEIELENPDEKERRRRKWKKNRAFYRGNQRGFWDTKKKDWITIDLDVLSPSEASVLVINNQFRPQVKTLSKEFSRSQTRIRTNAMSDSQQSILASRFADSLIKYYQPILMPESKRQLEAKYLFLCGNAFRYTYQDKEKVSANVTAYKQEQKMLEPYRRTLCIDCGEDQAPNEEMRCPKCKGALETSEVEGKEYTTSIPYKTNAGDPVTEIVDPTEIEVWSGASQLSESPYLRRKRIVKEQFIVDKFPFFEPPKDAKLSSAGEFLYSFWDTSSSEKVSSTKLHEFDQLWLVPAYYRRAVTEKDFTYKTMIDGKVTEKVIPKGTVMVKEFPDGLYICKVGKEILGLENEDKMSFWIHIPFDGNVDGFWADGLEDSIMNQQIINEYTSLSVENVLYNASPKLVINPSLINPATVTGRPKDMLLMSDNARKDKPSDAFAQISGMSLTSEVMMGIEGSKRDMREQTGALLAFNGQGDSNITTATGASIARDSALALISTPLAVRAEKDQEWAWQVIKLVKKYWYDHKYKFLLGKYNESESTAFRDSDLKETLNLYIEPNSWMPLTNYEKLENLVAYLTAFGLPMGFLNPQIPQAVRDYASQLYNVPFDFNELAPDIRIAQKRLDIAKELAGMYIGRVTAVTQALMISGKTDEAMTLLQNTRKEIADAMGVEEDIDEHDVFIREYKNWLKTDEGQNAHPILREAVKQAIADHKAFLTVQQGEDYQNAIMTGGGSQPDQIVAQPPPTSPFQPPKQEIKDFSQNAKKS